MNPSSGGELGPSHFSVPIYKIAMILSATKIFFFFLGHATWLMGS